MEKSYSEVNALDAKIYTESTSYKWIFEVQNLWGSGVLENIIFKFTKVLS